MADAPPHGGRRNMLWWLRRSAAGAPAGGARAPVSCHRATSVTSSVTISITLRRPGCAAVNRTRPTPLLREKKCCGSPSYRMELAGRVSSAAGIGRLARAQGSPGQVDQIDKRLVPEPGAERQIVIERLEPEAMTVVRHSCRVERGVLPCSTACPQTSAVSTRSIMYEHMAQTIKAREAENDLPSRDIGVAVNGSAACSSLRAPSTSRSYTAFSLSSCWAERTFRSTTQPSRANCARCTSSHPIASHPAGSFAVTHPRPPRNQPAARFLKATSFHASFPGTTAIQQAFLSIFIK